MIFRIFTIACLFVLLCGLTECTNRPVKRNQKYKPVVSKPRGPPMLAISAAQERRFHITEWSPFLRQFLKDNRIRNGSNSNYQQLITRWNQPQTEAFLLWLLILVLIVRFN